MKLVEVIKGLATSEGTLEKTLKLAEDMGKTTAMAEDVPGFIANRLLIPYLNEAVFALAEVCRCSGHSYSRTLLVTLRYIGRESVPSMTSTQ